MEGSVFVFIGWRMFLRHVIRCSYLALLLYLE